MYYVFLFISILAIREFESMKSLGPKFNCSCGGNQLESGGDSVSGNERECDDGDDRRR